MLTQHLYKLYIKDYLEKTKNAIVYFALIVIFDNYILS